MTFFHTDNRDVINRILSLLPHDDWVCVRKTAKIFQGESEDAIMKRKNMYYITTVICDVPHDSKYVRTMATVYEKMIKRADLLRDLVISKSVYGDAARVLFSFTKAQCNHMIGSSDYYDKELIDVLKRWMVIADLIDIDISLQRETH